MTTISVNGRWRGRRIAPEQRAEQLWGNCTNTDDPDACWEWRGSYTGPPFANGKRYGALYSGGRNVRVHVQAWILTHGPVPEGLIVRHVVCYNPPCCNPAHLAVGTHQDNHDDMVRDGRSTRGEKNAQARLTALTVLEIRRRYAAGDETLLSLAIEYGISFQHVSDIIRRRRWAHLEESS